MNNIFIQCPRCMKKTGALVSSIFSDGKVCIDCKRKEIMEKSHRRDSVNKGIRKRGVIK